jgi:hypothetical protein
VASVTGWGRGSWNDGAWGTALPIAVTEVAGTTGLGSVTVTADSNVSVTGLAGTGAIGTVIASSPKVVDVTGVLGTFELNSVSVWGQITPDQTPNWAAIQA